MKREPNITKDEFLSADTYIFTAAKITKNGITGFNFYLLKNGDFKRVIGGRLWREEELEGYHHVVAWGTSRTLEVLLSVADELGIKHGEVNQRKAIFL